MVSISVFLIGQAVIKRIELHNFMSHEHTVIDLADGLTVLVGPNNCGKSAVIMALQVLCHNEKSTFVRRHGAKECRIVVHTDDDHVVEWQRKKSGSPVYLIDGRPLDRVRQNNNYQDQIHSILRLPKLDTENGSGINVHFGEQKSPAFLVNDSASKAARFFASSSDAAHLVQMQEKHKSNVRTAKSDLSRVLRESATLERSLKTLEPLDGIRDELRQAEKAEQQLERDSQTVGQLGELIQNLEEASVTHAYQSTVGTVMRPLQSPPEWLPTGPVAELVQHVSDAKMAKQTHQRRAKVLDLLLEPPLLTMTDGISKLAVEIAQAERDCFVHEQAAAVLDTLPSPPQMESQQPLAELVTSLEAAMHEQRVAEARFEGLAALTEPPKPREQQPLFQLIQEMALAENELKKSMANHNQIVELAVATKKAIERWAEENPVCPTCGHDVESGELLSRGGGHRHG